MGIEDKFDEKVEKVANKAGVGKRVVIVGAVVLAVAVVAFMIFGTDPVSGVIE